MGACLQRSGICYVLLQIDLCCVDIRFCLVDSINVYITHYLFTMNSSTTLYFPRANSCAFHIPIYRFLWRALIPHCPPSTGWLGAEYLVESRFEVGSDKKDTFLPEGMLKCNNNSWQKPLPALPTAQWLGLAADFPWVDWLWFVVPMFRPTSMNIRQTFINGA